MLRLIGSHYHFRQDVPVAVQARLGRTEISLSLQTQSKLVARERAAALYARTGALFEKAKTMETDLSRKELIALLTEQGKIIAEQEELLTLADDAFRAEKRALQADHAMTLMDQVQKEGAFISFATDSLKALESWLQSMMQKVFTDSAVSKKEKDMLREQIKSLSTLIVDLGKHRPAASVDAPAGSPVEDEQPKTRKPTSPPLSTMAEKFVFADKDKSEDTKKATRKTVDLFIEAFGDMPVKQITGTVAGEFFDLLSDLPATHGKGRTGQLALLADSQKSEATKKETARTVALFVQAYGDKPVKEITGGVAGTFRDLLFTLPTSYAKGKQEMDLNAEVERAQELDLPTLSGKSVKNHFMRLSALWNQLIRREIADKNPWSNWDFDLTKRNPRRAWTDDELALLSSSPWTCSTISQANRLFIEAVLIVTVQAFPGVICLPGSGTGRTCTGGCVAGAKAA